MIYSTVNPRRTPDRVKRAMIVVLGRCYWEGSMSLATWQPSSLIKTRDVAMIIETILA